MTNTAKRIKCFFCETLSEIFTDVTKPTLQHITNLMFSILALNGFSSVRFNYDHAMRQYSDASLNSFYRLFQEGRIDIDTWFSNILKASLSIINSPSQPIVLSIDDTLAEKVGTKFENVSILFNHADSNFLNGHCFVSLLASIPIIERNKCHYVSIPIGYRMWKKEKEEDKLETDDSLVSKKEDSKLVLAADLVSKAMEIIGTERQVILCCDSWYPKKEVADLVTKYSNLAIICNVRRDTYMFEFMNERTGKRGRPKNHRDISINDIPLHPVSGSDFCVGSRKVMTRLFGKKEVCAIATQSKTSGTKRLFLCTELPENIAFDPDFIDDSCKHIFDQKNEATLPLLIYSLRWNIEVCYYQQKTYWALEKYMVRSTNGIERLINIQTILFSLMSMLPYLNPIFNFIKDCSPQQARFLLGDVLKKEGIFAIFEEGAKEGKLGIDLIEWARNRVFNPILAISSQ